MDYNFSSQHSLIKELYQYLTFKEQNLCRPVSKQFKESVVLREQQLAQRGIVKCKTCPAFIQTKGPLRCVPLQTAWCGMCEGFVCKSHLQRCYSCNNVFCSSCVGFCC